MDELQKQQRMEYLEGIEKDGKGDGDTYCEICEIEANNEERILKFIESAP